MFSSVSRSHSSRACNGLRLCRRAILYSSTRLYRAAMRMAIQSWWRYLFFRGIETILYDYIDDEYNGIMSKTRIRFPQLNQKDLLLIALTCLEFSYIQSAIIMGYSNHTSIGTLKHRLAEKMELDGSLNDYIHYFNHPWMAIYLSIFEPHYDSLSPVLLIQK